MPLRATCLIRWRQVQYGTTCKSKVRLLKDTGTGPAGHGRSNRASRGWYFLVDLWHHTDFDDCGEASKRAHKASRSSCTRPCTGPCVRVSIDTEEIRESGQVDLCLMVFAVGPGRAASQILSGLTCTGSCGFPSTNAGSDGSPEPGKFHGGGHI